MSWLQILSRGLVESYYPSHFSLHALKLLRTYKMMIQSREADASPWLRHYLYVSLYSHKCEYSPQYLYVCLCNRLYITWNNRKCAVKLFFFNLFIIHIHNESDQIECVFCKCSSLFRWVLPVCVHISCLSGRVFVSARCTNWQKPSLKACREHEQYFVRVCLNSGCRDTLHTERKQSVSPEPPERCITPS